MLLLNVTIYNYAILLPSKRLKLRYIHMSYSVIVKNLLNCSIIIRNILHRLIKITDVEADEDMD